MVKGNAASIPTIKPDNTEFKIPTIIKASIAPPQREPHVSLFLNVAHARLLNSFAVGVQFPS